MLTRIQVTLSLAASLRSLLRLMGVLETSGPSSWIATSIRFAARAGAPVAARHVATMAATSVVLHSPVIRKPLRNEVERARVGHPFGTTRQRPLSCPFDASVKPDGRVSARARGGRHFRDARESPAKRA